jgi:hypothetical protein
MSTLLTEASLAAALANRGLLNATAADDAATANDRPWFIAALLGAAGWLAGVFVLSFVYLLFEPESAAGYGMAGAILLAAAYGLYLADRAGSFFEQLALALSIAGQIAISIAVAEGTESAAATTAAVTVMQIALLVILPNALARSLAAFFACVAWALTVRAVWWDRSLFDFRGEPIAMAPALLGWLAIWAPIIAAQEWLVRNEREWLASPLRRIARPASSGAIAALAIATWVSEPFSSLPFVARSDVTSWLALWPLLGVLTALYAAVCAARLRARALLGLAIAGGLVHAMQFYYVLGTTLVVKSAIMLAVGAALLTAAWALRRGTTAGDTP